eukprot:gene31872-39374_t
MIKNRYGDFYDGDVVDFRMHGRGQYTYHDGRVIIGQWINDYMQGPGRCINPDGTIYEGMFRNSFEHGPGVMKAADDKTVLYKGVLGATDGC